MRALFLTFLLISLTACDPNSKSRISNQVGSFAHEGSSASLKGLEESILGGDEKKSGKGATKTPESVGEQRVKKAARGMAAKTASILEGNVEGQISTEASSLVSGFLA